MSKVNSNPIKWNKVERHIEVTSLKPINIKYRVQKKTNIPDWVLFRVESKQNSMISIIFFSTNEVNGAAKPKIINKPMEVYINQGSKRASLLNINLYISHNNFIRIIYSLFAEEIANLFL